MAAATGKSQAVSYRLPALAGNLPAKTRKAVDLFSSEKCEDRSGILQPEVNVVIAGWRSFHKTYLVKRGDAVLGWIPKIDSVTFDGLPWSGLCETG